ncbi:MAG: DsbA family protein, partial [Rhodospirillales bacterium]|nr:DsbA family protein [Rhodospirillales bacterium]
GPLTEDKLADALDSAQVDMARLKADLSSRATEIQAALDEADGQARAIGLDGTPAFIVGDYLLPGAVSLENLRRIVKDVRKKPGAADIDRT